MNYETYKRERMSLRHVIWKYIIKGLHLDSKRKIIFILAYAVMTAILLSKVHAYFSPENLINKRYVRAKCWSRYLN